MKTRTIAIFAAAALLASVAIVGIEAKTRLHPTVHGYSKYIPQKALGKVHFKKAAATAPGLASASVPGNTTTDAAGTYFVASGGTLSVSGEMVGRSWGPSVAIASQDTGFKFNLGQPAHAYDLALDLWTVAFVPKVTIREGDNIQLCGPTDAEAIEIYDSGLDQIVFNDVLTGIPEC